jgi:hypothetical protein
MPQTRDHNEFIGALFHGPDGMKTRRRSRANWTTMEQGFEGRSIMMTSGTRYEIRFQSLFNEGRALTFPCDAEGHVEMDALSDRARNNYLYARAVVGREFAAPAILPSDVH